MNTQAPPHNDEMEMAVIGCMLIDGPESKLVVTRTDPEWFYNDKYKAVFKVLAKYIEDGHKPDMVLASQWLTNAGILAEVGGTPHLADCMDKVSTLAHTEAYINELRKLHLDRAIVVAVAVTAADPSPENIEKLRMRSQERDTAGVSGIISIKDCYEKIEEMMQPRDKGLYEIFGMEEMDKYHNGMSPGNILTIAARPGVGKTVISTHIAINFANKYREPVLYFSTEMPHEETLQRVLSPMSRIPGWKFRKRIFSKDGADHKAIAAAAGNLMQLNFHMVDKPSPTMADIRAAMIATKCKLVIVDYIQRMNLEVGREGRPAALGAVMTSIKNSCRDCNCLGIVVSAMDRETDKLTGRARPQLADLKGSGDIEQESDAVILMWKHNKKEDGQFVVPDVDLIRPIEAIFAKNRHGTSDVSTQLIFDEKFIEFREWNKAEEEKYRGMAVKKSAENAAGREESHATKSKKHTWGKNPASAGGFTPDPDAKPGD